MERFDTAVRTAISIHAPREGSDRAVGYDFDGISAISIHAPREGSDVNAGVLKCCMTNFNPRSPRGERLASITRRAEQGKFQSTLPARGATISAFRCKRRRTISIHAPREGSDLVR